MKRVITLPGGRVVTIGEYVRSWRILKTLPPDREVARWTWHPVSAGEILRDIRRGIHDRINQAAAYSKRGTAG